MSTAIVNMPERPDYGATELKEYIRRSTVRGFILTVCLLILLFLIYFVVNMVIESRNTKIGLAPVAKISLSDLPPPPSNAAEPPPPPPANLEVVASGPPVRAGNPVPVPDAQIPQDLKDFASTDLISRATAEGGSGDMGAVGIGEGVDVGNVQVSGPIEQEPDPDEFITYDKEAHVDLGDIQKRIVYPEIAKRAGIEGRVTIQVLIGKDGRPKKTKILDSPSDLLNEAAIKAVMAGVYTPARQGKDPAEQWLSIPVVFRLK